MNFYILYPALLAAIPVLGICAKNAKEIKPIYCAVLLFFSSAVSIALFLLLAYAAGFSHKASACFLAFIIMCFYTPWYKWARLLSRYYYQYIIKFIIYACLSLSIFYIDGKLPAVLSAILALIAGILAANVIIGGGKNSHVSGESKHDENIIPVKIKDDDKPDIYHIVFDAYAGIHALKIANNFDNCAFCDNLRKMGFEVTENAYSNYNHTSASLSSMMNMDYTKGFLTENDLTNPMFINDNQHYRFLYVLKSAVIKSLKSAEYKFITTGEPLFSEFFLNQCMDIIDSVGNSYNPILKNSLYANFFKTTFLGGLFAASNNNMKVHTQYIKDTLNYAGNLTENSSPFYSFTHIWAPHAPYCFNEDGSVNKKFADIGDMALDDDDTRNAYAAHLKYLNTLIEETMQKLIGNIKAKGRKAIVLIHGDHGVFATHNKVSEYNVLLGVYKYGFGNENIFPDNVSLINVFPLIFSHCFKTSVNIKKDKYFYENWHAADYNEQDITEEMEAGIKQVKENENNRAD